VNEQIAGWEIRLHEHQWRVYQSKARFRVLVAGRRFGKTHLALTEMVQAALEGSGRMVWYVGPSDQQAKTIAWERLKEMTRPLLGEAAERDGTAD
jgi:hypothetical protein